MHQARTPFINISIGYYLGINFFIERWRAGMKSKPQTLDEALLIMEQQQVQIDFLMKKLFGRSSEKMSLIPINPVYLISQHPGHWHRCVRNQLQNHHIRRRRNVKRF